MLDERLLSIYKKLVENIPDFYSELMERFARQELEAPWIRGAVKMNPVKINPGKNEPGKIVTIVGV
jgi:hypothetical protein